MPQLQWTLEEIAAIVGGTLQGEPDILITGAASVEEAEPGDIVFAESERFRDKALQSPASAVLISTALAPEVASKPLICVENARLSFVQLLEAFAFPLSASPGIHSTAQIADDVTIGEACSIGAHVTVETGVVLGSHVVVMTGARIGANCRIGDDTILYPNVVLYPGISVGRRCLLHAGCVIGSDGYGYVQVGRALKKIPHLGTVEIGNEVEIGANTCIDRAKTGATVIGSGTKIDNLVHIAHNCRIGQYCLIIAQVGIAGSTEVGNGVVLAGQVGLKDHITIGDGARVGAQGGVISNIPAGATYSGYPARPHAEKMREYAASAALPDTIKRIRALEKRIAELERRADKETE